MDPSFEQSIVSQITSVITTAVTTFQARNNDKIVSFYKIIEKFLFLNIVLLSFALSSDSETFAKDSILAKILVKTLSKR